MMIIDSQVHAYDANTPQRPWKTKPNWQDHVTGDEMVAAMDELGIDGAIFISAFSIYGYDSSYAVEVQQKHPDRFGIVKPVDPDDPNVEDVIADWKGTPGAVGVRIMVTKDPGTRPGPGRSRLRPHTACGRQARFPGQLSVLGQSRRGYPDHRPPPRRAIHHRPPCHPAAARARALRRSPGRTCRRSSSSRSARTR